MKKILAFVIAAVLLVQCCGAALAYFDKDGAPEYTYSETALSIGGNEIKNGKGFLKNFAYLTEDQMSELMSRPSGEVTYKYGLGDSFGDMVTFSAYENHGTPTWIYSKVYGLDINELATALGVDTNKVMSVSVASTDGGSKVLPDAFNVNTKRFYFDVNGKEVCEVMPMLSLFKTSVTSFDAGYPGSSAVLPSSPDLRSEEDACAPTFTFGQTAKDEITKCYWLKYVNHLRIGSESPAITITDDAGTTTNSISGIVKYGVYNTSAKIDGDGYSLMGIPLSVLFEKMGKTVSNGDVVTAVSRNGEKLMISASQLESAFVAWDATCNGKAVSNNTAQQLYVFGKDGSAVKFEDLTAFSIDSLPFDDLGNYSWCHAAVMALYDSGVVAGVGENKFQPASNIKRGDFMLMLYRAYDFSGSGDGFDDVSESKYYYDAVTAGKALGIAKGDENKFRPEDNITRQEAMTLIYRTLTALGADLTGYSTELNGFKDAGSVASWAKNAVAVLVDAGVINGSGGYLNPNSPMTRAEMTTALYRAIENIGIGF